MSKKFFSLISGDSLLIAPKTKIVTAKAFSTMLDAKEVIKTAKEDAKAYRLAVAEECETLKEQAQKEGYEAGFSKWAEHIAKLQQEIDSIRDEYVKILAPVALKATQKIVGSVLETSKDAVFDIVANSLKPVMQHKKITIYVNKNDLEYLEKKRQELKGLFESVEVLSIRERGDVSAGGCVIETEGGIINARLENQWAILEQAFHSIFKGLKSTNKKKKTKDKPSKSKKTKKEAVESSGD